jgi:hypothetical protein
VLFGKFGVISNAFSWPSGFQQRFDGHSLAQLQRPSKNPALLALADAKRGWTPPDDLDLSNAVASLCVAHLDHAQNPMILHWVSRSVTSLKTALPGSGVLSKEVRLPKQNAECRNPLQANVLSHHHESLARYLAAIFAFHAKPADGVARVKSRSKTQSIAKRNTSRKIRQPIATNKP